MTAPLEETNATQPPKDSRILHVKDENEDSKSIYENESSRLSEGITLTPQSLSPQMSSTHNASQEPKKKTQNGTEARTPNSDTRREQLTVENTTNENNHLYDQRPSEEKDDMEAAAYEELRQSAFKALQFIEEDFAKLRERLYHERLAELDKEVQAIASGKHPEYATAHAEIETRRRKLLNEASKWRQHKEIDIGRQVESSLRLAHVHFLAKRAEIRRSIINNITEKRRKLRDEMACSDDLVAVPDLHMIRHIREHNAKENKEVVDISLDVGFPIGAKPSGLEVAEAESDVRMTESRWRVPCPLQEVDSHKWFEWDVNKHNSLQSVQTVSYPEIYSTITSCWAYPQHFSTTRFTPTIVKGRRHSAPAARAGLSVSTVDIKNESKVIARPKVKESISEPEQKQSESSSHPKSILKRESQGKSALSHSRRVRFPSPDTDLSIVKQKTRRTSANRNLQPFNWMAKRPKRKARIVDIDRLLEESAAGDDDWDTIDIEDTSSNNLKEIENRGESADSSITLKENPFAPQIRLKDGLIVLETGHDSSSTTSNEPQKMEIVEE
ncbi:hypothetical protein NQZ79_g1420 [Umbelopsis isabellina]|nr:hypothetical protein NQZ79_g1420 [Umbelopsis isabellina]